MASGYDDDRDDREEPSGDREERHDNRQDRIAREIGRASWRERV